MSCKKILGLILGSGIIVSCIPAASAATISCSGPNYDISAKVSNASACAILAPLDGEQTENPANVNAGGFFGINNWVREGRYQNLTDIGGTDTSNLFAFTGNRESGSFTYTGGATPPTSVLFVFDSGANTNLVGYLLNLSNASGTYSTPFTEPPFDFGNDRTRNIARIGVYVSPNVARVPEPASLALVGLGLLGLLKRRRRV